MDIVEALLQLNRVAGDVDQPTDLQIGTVVKAPPDDDVLEISINTEMATLRQDILYLAEPVIEKKIPLLKHRHAMPHIHAGVHGSTGSPSEPYTGYSLLSGGADSSVQSEDIKGWENGKVLSLSKDKKYIILNPALKAGDKVLLLRVQRGACGGCFNKIPPQKQLDIKLRKKVIVCEYCGRIMIDPELAGVED